MHRFPLRFATAAVLLLLAANPWAAPAETPTEEDPVMTARAAFMNAEGDEARFAVVKAFLDEHPEHPELISVLEAGAYVMAYGLGDREGAVKLLRSHLDGADERSTRRIRNTLVELASTPDAKGLLEGLVDEFYDPAAMSFGDHLNVLRAATGAEAWGLVDAQVGLAESKATAEAFRADYPSSDYDDAYVKASGDNRRGMLMTYAGWALSRKGDLQGALDVFDQAEPLLRHGFSGLPENELSRFRGLTLLDAGEMEQGLELLALAGLFASDSEAAIAAEQTWSELGRAEDGYDDYLWSLRLEHAPEVGDFTATDYEGSAHRFTDLRGEKATLLAFWFPT